MSRTIDLKIRNIEKIFSGTLRLFKFFYKSIFLSSKTSLNFPPCTPKNKTQWFQSYINVDIWKIRQFYIFGRSLIVVVDFWAKLCCLPMTAYWCWLLFFFCFFALLFLAGIQVRHNNRQMDGEGDRQNCCWLAIDSIGPFGKVVWEQQVFAFLKLFLFVLGRERKRG